MSKQRHSLDRTAFHNHKWNAKERGIAFEFTYEQWRSWWETELAKLGPTAKRGCKRTNYGMCRFSDRGPMPPATSTAAGQSATGQTTAPRSISTYARKFRHLMRSHGETYKRDELNPTNSMQTGPAGRASSTA